MHSCTIQKRRVMTPMEIAKAYILLYTHTFRPRSIPTILRVEEPRVETNGPENNTREKGDEMTKTYILVGTIIATWQA